MKLNKYQIKFILLLLIFNTSCFNQSKEDTLQIKNEVDNYLANTMELHNIPGLALAVIEDDKVIYKNYFGSSSLENNIQVDKSTLFRVFSATKLITSVGVFQLIQQGKLNLKDKIAQYLNDLPTQWQEIQINNLLSHSSGLPDIIRYKSTLSDKELMGKLAKDKMDFATGNQFRYNQTNYWLLAQIIEKITGTTFDEYIFTNQFYNATAGVLFSSDSRKNIPDRAIRYFYNGKTKEFEEDSNNSGKRGHSGNGLNITLDRFIEWNKLLDNNELLDQQSKNKMWTPFDFTNQKDNFLHGWGIYPINGLSSYGFSGGNLAAFRKFVNEKTTIILLSNGYEIPAYDIIINDIARIVIPKLRDKNPTLEEDVMRHTINSNFSDASQSFKNLKRENSDYDLDNLKWNINSIGNAFAYNDDYQKAREVYEFNAEANPDWWISSAGIAETYEAQKDSLNAIKNYQKAILLNMDNEWDYNEEMKKKIDELNHN